MIEACSCSVDGVGRTIFAVKRSNIHAYILTVLTVIGGHFQCATVLIQRPLGVETDSSLPVMAQTTLNQPPHPLKI